MLGGSCSECCGNCVYTAFCKKDRKLFVSCTPRASSISAMWVGNTLTWDWIFNFAPFSATLKNCPDPKFGDGWQADTYTGTNNHCTLFREDGDASVQHSCFYNDYIGDINSRVRNDYFPFVTLEVFPLVVNGTLVEGSYTLTLTAAKWFEKATRTYFTVGSSRTCESPGGFCDKDFLAIWKWTSGVYDVPMCALMDSLGVLNLTLQNTSYTSSLTFGNAMFGDWSYTSSSDTSLDVQFVNLP